MSAAPPRLSGYLVLTANSKRNKICEVLLNFGAVELLARHGQLTFSETDFQN